MIPNGRSAENSKEHILKTALELFLQKNFKEVTMKELVEKTGLSKGAFYHYFPSKEQLFVEVIENYYFVPQPEFNKISDESLFDFYHEYIKRADNFIFALSKDTAKDTTQKIRANIYIMMFDALNRFPKFRERAQKKLETKLKAWEKIICIARKKGEIKSPKRRTNC